MASHRTWDIFCNVVDNYGDIGVSWRLARQLAAEYGFRVRLWVDDLESFRRLAPEIDPARAGQSSRGVEVRHWTKPFPDVVPGDVVVEAFGTALPDRFLDAMAAKEAKPFWINLEYLSAEDWVQSCHGLASPHPRLPLVKHFFFPGFVRGTGGLLLEQGLAERRRAFQEDPAAAARFWQSLGLPEPRTSEIRISLFCYENRAIPGLLEAWARAGHPVCCLVPEGRALKQVSAFFGQEEGAPGNVFFRDDLEVRVLPFVEQEAYDSLLWACDCNFVRGEDSFVRAQWAARPLVWHIYPQEDEAHRKKLQAFMNLYCAELPMDAMAGLHAFWEAWNHGEGAGEAWQGFWQHREALEGNARRWADRLLQHGDLALNLVQFFENRLK
jgi:uncharacterized repeat protein (TIGR03837 family)